MAREIALTNGMVALVDDVDFERLAAHRWYPAKGRLGAVYALRSFDRVRSDGSIGSTTRQMQRDVLDPDFAVSRSLLADYINGDTLDCRRENLRWAPFNVSNRNRRMFSRNTIGYRGVARQPSGLYRAQVHADGKRYSTPAFSTAVEAAAAYNELATKVHGADARLNDVPPDVVLSPRPTNSGRRNIP